VKETSTVTVVLPIRLATETIESTLESLFSQVHDYAVEIIAVGCEGDPTLSKVTAIRRPNFRYIAVQGKHGIPYLRGCGVTASRAEFVLIAEDQCIYPDNWIRSLVGAIERTNAAGSFREEESSSSPGSNIAASSYVLRRVVTRRNDQISRRGRRLVQRHGLAGRSFAAGAEGRWNIQIRRVLVRIWRVRS